MIYSNFNWESGLYDYYEGNGEGRGVRPIARKIMVDSKGHPIENLLPVIPAGSRAIGRGKQAKGRLAVLEGVFDENPLKTHPWLTLGIWTGAIIVSVKLASYLGKKVEEKARKR